MDTKDARRILGVGPAASAEEIQGVWQAKRNGLERRIVGAPDDGLRGKFQESLSELDRALEVLLGGSGVAPGLRPSQIRDLGRAQPQGAAAGAGPDATLAPGTVLRGRYEIVSLLAKGGMGAVYEAEDREVGERIALKVLLPRLAVDRDAQARFRNEGKIARKLLHQGCVRVYDVDSDGELYFLTMEVLRGCTLREVMNERQKSGRGFAVAEVLQIARELGDALVYAHSQDVVHRDVKPENIWVTKEGRYKLLDFGLAKVPTASDFTQAAQQMGTAYYVAPEQLKGSRAVDHRADQYSLGVVLYELLTGDVPTGTVRPLHPRVAGVSKALSDAIQRAMEGDPNGRFASVSSLTTSTLQKHKPNRLIGLIVLLPGLSISALFTTASMIEAWEFWVFGRERYDPSDTGFLLITFISTGYLVTGLILAAALFGVVGALKYSKIFERISLLLALTYVLLWPDWWRSVATTSSSRTSLTISSNWEDLYVTVAFFCAMGIPFLLLRRYLARFS